ncbi:MAG: Ser-Thr-rich GPI-anchored membrane family protein [Candidatus Omnitrophota bacterium]
MSDYNFAIRPQLSITQPVLNQNVVVASSTNVRIVRTSSSVSNVKLEYSNDGGSTYTTIPGADSFALTADTTDYSWTVPDAISQTVLVRATDTGNSSIVGTSANFRIIGKLELTDPNGGENWQALSTTNNITWIKTGSIVNVKLYYSTNSGSTYPTLINTIPAGNQSYLWSPMPEGASNTVRVKVTDATNESVVFDASDADFSIIGTFSIVHPTNGESLVAETPYTIEWNKTGTGIANVVLQYSKDGGSNYTNIGTVSNTGTYNWTVPASAITTDGKVKLYDPNNLNAYAISNGKFKIHGSFNLTRPVGSEIWIYNTHENITWTKKGDMQTCKLEYSTNSGSTYPYAIATGVNPLTGTPYDWTIPDKLSTTVRVKITDENDSGVYDESDDFIIRGILTLEAPNGGEVWVVDTTENISWTRTGSITNVKLEYSTNNGSTYPNVIIGSTLGANGSYAWDIPDAISTALKVKITDLTNSLVFDESAIAFSIKGALSLGIPNGGQIWFVGEGKSITWTRTGSITNVRLDYSKDGGTSYPYNIVEVTDASTGSYPWSVPDALGSAIRVKITDTTNSTVTDSSDGNFTIKGALSLNTPNGGESWTVGNQYDITWSRTGSIANVKLEYSINSGQTWTGVVINSTDASTGTYRWTVPNIIGTHTRIMISDYTDASVKDTSEGDFNVIGSITVTSPNGSEAWVVNSQYPITWTIVGSIATVKIDYSTDGGSSYLNEIIASTDAVTGSYNWTIPDNICSTVKVKITNTAYSSVTDTSDLNFKIIGSFTLGAPNGGENWKVGSKENITWTKVGAIANAKLSFSTDGGTSYPNVIVASTPVAALSYEWTIPDNIGFATRVKISDYTDSDVYDVSNANFTIKAGFTIIKPDGGEVWKAGESEFITWTTVGTALNVKLDYSTDGGSTYPYEIVAFTPNTLSYAWSIANTLSPACKVKISDVNNSDAFDVSNNNFKIRGTFTIVQPDGGQSWEVATHHDITWTKTGNIQYCKLDYSKNSGSTYPYSIATNVNPATGTPYDWTIPDAISTTVRVKITDSSDSTVFDESDGDFIIRGRLTLNSPNGTESWIVGTAHAITWTRFGTIPFVDLAYSTNSGFTYPNVIIEDYDASLQTYPWDVPDLIGTDRRVKVTDSGNANVFDTSDSDFTIRGAVTVLIPNGGQIWTVGSSYDITWTRTGSVANVRLDYSIDGGTSYPSNIIAITDASTGKYNWTVADAVGTKVRIKITDITNPEVFDTSDGNFTIKGALRLKTPNGIETLYVGDSYDITWERTGSVVNVKLEYSTDGGSSYPNTIIDSINASLGTYNWSVADAIGTALKVRVSDAENPDVFDTSNSDFTIKGTLTVTSPNSGNEAWVVNSTNAITWNKTGSFANVKLEYSTNGFLDELQTVTIIASTPAGGLTGSYNWQIPNAISSTVKVKITHTSDGTISDISNLNFKIIGALTVGAPNGGEGWAVAATNQYITWSRVGTIVNVKLQYSTDSGSTYPSENIITASTPTAAFSYQWTIPDSVGNHVRVKISDTSDSTVYDESNADFEILAGFTIVQPNGTEKWTIGDVQNIVWNITGTTANAKLEYSADSGSSFPFEIIASTDNDGTYGWTIPDYVSDNIRVRVSDVNNSRAKDVSNNNFSIIGGFGITAPVFSEILDVNSGYTITWNKTGTTSKNRIDPIKVKLEYSTDDGSTYTTIATNETNDGSYSWTSVPDAISVTAKIRISDTLDTSAYNVSPQFKICADFDITQPDGGEVWTADENKTIIWTWKGTVPFIKLDYSTDSGSTFPNIIANSAANGPGSGGTASYAWTVPDMISTNVRVRIMSTTNVYAYDVSAADFKIRGALRITAPNGGESAMILQPYTIIWVTTGTIPDVKLQYSIDGGTSWPVGKIITNSVSNTGSYPWTVPDDHSGNARMRVLDTRDSSVYDDSNNDFSISGWIHLTSPNGAESWIAGRIYPITWEWGGTMPFVKLSYSKDSGSTFPQVISNGAPNGSGGGGSYSFNWTIPDDITQQFVVRVKVEDASVPATNDISDGNFKIRANFTIVHPNGGERWIVNRTETISWTTEGTVPNVKIDYSTDGGSSYPYIIESSMTNSGSRTWTIPNTKSDTARLRITDTRDASILSASASTFKMDYYVIRWNIRNMLDGSQITLASVTSPNWSENNVVAEDVDPDPTKENFLFVHGEPYGSWKFTWSTIGYSEKWISVTADQDQDVELLLESTSVHIWRSGSNYAYSADPDGTGPEVDFLGASVWLERDGVTVTGGVWCELKIYDGATLIKTFKVPNEEFNEEAFYNNPTPPNAAGVYTFSWSNTGLAAGKVYTTAATVQITTGGSFTSPNSFEVTSSKRLAEMATQMNYVLDKPISEVNTEIQKTLNDQTDVIEQKLQAQETIIVQRTDEMKAQVTATMASFERDTRVAITDLQSGADTATAAGLSLEATAKQYSWSASVSPDPAVVNDTVTLQCTGYPGSNPVLTLYSWDNKVLVGPIEIPETEDGVYPYEFKIDATFDAGKAYTYIIYDETTSGMVAGSGLIDASPWRATIAPNPALIGDNVSLTVSGVEGLEPYINIYDTEGNAVVDTETLTESKTQRGIYTYELTISSRFSAGKAYIYVVSEARTSGEIRGTLNVESMSLTTVAGLAAAAPGAERAAKAALESIKAVESVIITKDNINIPLALQHLKQSVEELPTIIAREGGSTAKMTTTVTEISKRLKELAGSEGYDISTLFEQALTSSPTIKDIRASTDEINGVIDVLYQIFENKFGGTDAPVVSTSLQPGSVKFRIVTMNPSKVKEQLVNVKQYLPKEVNNKNIMDLGGLDLEYDTDKSLYYVYKNNVKLTPGEIRIFEVEVEDVWFVREGEVSDLKNRIDSIMSRLENTEYYEKAKEIAEPLYPQLNEIVTSQNDESVSRQQHIGLYRQNLITIEKIKEEIAQLEKALATAGGPLAPEMLAKTKIKSTEPTKAITWLIIFIIIIFLGLLAAVMFFIWQRQARLTREELFAAKKAAAFKEEPGSEGEEEKGPEEENP